MKMFKTQMRKLQEKKKIFICIGLLFAILLGLFPADVAMNAAEKRTVKVAFFPMDGYHNVEEDGTYTGMDVKYLEALDDYVNWDVEYVPCDSWEDALVKLEEKQVDLVGSAQYTAERAEVFDYANLSSGFTFGAVVTNASSEIAYEDFVAMKDLTYGIVKGYVRQEEFYSYLSENGIKEPEVVEYESTAKLQNALQNGEIDAYAHTFTEVQEGQRLIGRFAPMPFYYITYKHNDEFLQQLNHAISDLKMARPSLEAELMNEFYYSRLDVNSLLTTEEKAYVEKKKTITVGYLDGFYPFSYEENGEFKGLSRQMLEESLEDTGLQFVYTKITNQTEGKLALANGAIDVLCYYTDGREYLSVNGIVCVNDYAEIPLAIVAQKGTDIEDIGVISTVSALSDNVEDAFDMDSVLLQICDTQQNCMNALDEELTEGVLCSAYLAEHVLRTQFKYNNLEVVRVLQREYPVTMLTCGSDVELTSILNKTLTVIDAKTINEYLLQENVYPLITIDEFFQNHSMQINLVMIAVVVAIIGITWHFVSDNRKIQKLMYKDTKMDIWNLNYFMLIGNQKQWNNKKNRYAVCHINLAYFRRYNIIYGWNAGEHLLEMVAEQLIKSVDAKEEICARNQGDRFALFLKVESNDSLMERLMQIKQTIEEKIYQETDNNIPVQMGIYIFPEGKVTDMRVAISYANQAVDFAANEKGSDIQVYDEDLENSIKERHAREKLLDKVDINKDFVAFYQPKVDIRTNQIIGAEALVRFKDPSEGGKIKSPAYFVPYFEQNGRITEVDFFVLESTCKMLQDRMNKGLPVVRVSVNFSRMHFIKQEFPEQLEAVLDKYNISKDLIEVEITETLVIEELQQKMIKKTLDAVKEKGFRLSIDDFGAGYSSLGVFEQIPASVVKLDRSFLLNQVDRERQVKIMRGIVMLSDELDAEIVCEGVETEQDIQLMQEIGAYVAQGYYYSKPIPQDEFEAKLDGEFAKTKEEQ